MPANFTIPEHIQTILRGSTFYIPDNPSPANLHTLKLPGQLSRKDYLDVMKVIEGAGGVWDKKKGLHTFRRDPSVELELAQTEGKGVNLQQKFQAFYTPAHVADQMVEMLNLPDDKETLRSGEALRVLEPSCGDGALIRAIRRASKLTFIVGYDINQEAIMKCGLGGQHLGPKGPEPACAPGRCHLLDFLTVKVPTKYDDLYDRVLSNPPFTKGQDAEHVCHALKFLRPSGRLVAIMSSNALDKETGHYKALRASLTGEFYRLVESTLVPAKTFKDTDIETLIVVIDRAH